MSSNFQKVLWEKGLSKQEAVIAEAALKGLSQKQLADFLFVTVKTVKFHLTNIYKKLKVNGRTEFMSQFIMAHPEDAFLTPVEKVAKYVTEERDNRDELPAPKDQVFYQKVL